MDKLKTEFSIKDLENLSGIKAHTIRIWEKRYDLFEPDRTDTNIRKYGSEELNKLLNVAYLNKNGIKISKIAELDKTTLELTVRDLAQAQNNDDHAIQSFKMAMMNFDQRLFEDTYQMLVRQYDFEHIFYKTFIPLMEELGVLWHTNTIEPPHEHFISALITQKLLLQIEKYQRNTPTNNSKLFILFLPDNEIHELGLMFTNYVLLKEGYQTIYLGASIPTACLKTFVSYHHHPIFLAYMTVKPESYTVKRFLKDFYRKIPPTSGYELYLMGRQAREMNKEFLQPKQSVFYSIPELVESL